MNEINSERLLTAQFPDLGTGPVSMEPYISSEYYEKERERIYRRCWLYAGRRQEEIPEVGDYFVQDIAVCDASVLITRGKDGEIRAFHNVCQHRGNKLVWDTEGKRKLFTCKFHGWSFDDAGKLLAVPDEDQFFDFCKDDHALRPVSVDTWNGFIFVNLQEEPENTLQEYLGDLGTLVSGYNFESKSLTYGYETDINCNWKLWRDSIVEGYHALFLHGKSMAKLIGTGNTENPMAHLLSFKAFGPHFVISVPGLASVKPSPVGALAAKLAPGLTRTQVRTEEQIKNFPSFLNPTKDPNWSFDIVFVFPNFQFHLWSDTYYLAYSYWPTAVDKTFANLRAYFPEPKNAGERFVQEYSKRMNRDVILEDLSTLEQIQSVLNSGAIKDMILQDQEVAVRYAAKTVDKYVSS